MAQHGKAQHSRWYAISRLPLEFASDPVWESPLVLLLVCSPGVICHSCCGERARVFLSHKLHMSSRPPAVSRPHHFRRPYKSTCQLHHPTHTRAL